MIVHANLTDAYLHAVGLVLAEGQRAVPRGLPTIEVPHPVHLTIEQPSLSFPLNGTTRSFRHAITAGEAMSLVGQTSVPEVILDSVKAFRPFLDGSIFWGAYGPRVAGDLINVVKLIDEDPDTRQAVLTIFDSDRDLGRTTMHDIPCTVFVQFRRRLHHLDMWVAMRSNDAWLGLPYDLGQFTVLQAAVAQALGVRVGLYHHSAGSMHLYQRNVDDARDLAQAVEPQDRFYFPHWTLPDEASRMTPAGRIGLISERCRRILIGQEVETSTDFEEWMRHLLHDRSI